MKELTIYYKMEKVYTSCIKINGVPILPPLMTNDLREEMNYYKQLASAVEERLKALDSAKEIKEMNEESLISNIDESLNSKIECEYLDKTPSRVTSTDYPTEVENVEKVDAKDLNDSCNRTSIGSWKSITDQENAYHNEAEVENNTSNDTISLSTDLNQYLNESTETSTHLDQLKKPQVPKTLDIIPVLEKDLSLFDNCKETLKDKEISEGTPKLIRRGSYILDTPSPMLLAQIQTEGINTDYIPTPTTNAIKRKEWNISQAKAEWDNQLKNNELVILNSSSTTMGFNLRRNSVPSVYNQKTYSTFYRSRSLHSVGFPQQAKSTDCIQTMIANEFATDDQRYHTTSSGTKCNTSYKETPKNSKENYDELGGSFDSVANSESHCFTKNESLQENGSSGSESYDNQIGNSNGIQSRNRNNPRVTFEKVLCIFKEVREQHKRRMSALIAQQYREQLHLEEDFKKQEKRLISEIKKAFPELSISSLTNDNSNIENQAPRTTRVIKSNPSHSKLSTSPHAKITKSPYSSVLSSPYSKSPSPYYSKPKINSLPNSKIISTRNIRSAAERCPLEGISPNKFVRSTSCHHMSNRGTQTIQCKSLPSDSRPTSEKQTNECLDDSFNDERIFRGQRQPTVSRILFPLESNSTLVPIVDNTIYTDKHIEAATTINAYTRGYLVRRLMKTEHILTLRNTYKEAIQCMLKLHVEAPLSLSELNFHQRLQLQCDAASMNIVEIFSRNPAQKMEIIAHDREIKKLRTQKPSTPRSYSFATQRTLARKKLKEMGVHQKPWDSKIYSARSRCQSWTANIKEKRSPKPISQGIKRSTSVGAVRKPWR